MASSFRPGRRRPGSSATPDRPGGPGPTPVARAARLGAASAALLAGLAAASPSSAAPTGAPGGDLVTKGEYLTRMGDCIACHTVPGGTPYAGGRYVETPFGTISSPNLTPDRETGIGDYSDDEFYRAMHEGVNRDGENLYPVFPYPWFTKVTRDDALAIKAYLFSLKPVHAPRKPNELMFPFNIRTGLAAWNTVAFDEGTFVPDPTQSPEVNRGAYLVEGLGHCGACHTPRNLTMASDASEAYAGAAIPGQDWYAPNISSNVREGIGAWTDEQIIAYLRTGVALGKGVAVGPMAETVHESLSHLTDYDARAIAAYLKSTPARSVEDEEEVADAAPSRGGHAVYLNNCASCHQVDGRGIEGAVPPLAGNGSVTAEEPDNVIKVVLRGLQARGGYGPMPGFGADLSDGQIAAVTDYVRTAWQNDGPTGTEAGDVAEIKESTPIDFDGNGSGCVRQVATETMAAAIDPGPGALGLMADITDANMYNRVGAILAEVESSQPDASGDAVVNGLTRAYCPILAEAPNLRPAERRWRLQRFSQTVYTRLRQGEQASGAAPAGGAMPPAPNRG